MSFPLKELLALYIQKESVSGDEIARGFGAEALYQFYFLLGVECPRTSDLTSGMLGAFSKHIRAELPTAVAEAYLWDTKFFLEFMYSGGSGWCAQDWAQCLNPKLEYKIPTYSACSTRRHCG